MLEISHVSAGYGEQDVVKDISFKVQKNENLCIIGPNGCGKTTLLKCIAGLLPFKGDVCIDGKSIRELKPRERSLKIAMLSQTANIHFSYSVFDTVLMGRYVYMKDRFFGTPSAEDRAYAEHCLKMVDMLEQRDHLITQLSGGQLQRVFLARALAQQPQIILLDEPTNHLDLKYQIELMHYLKSWSAEDGHAVIGVLHDINLAMELADHVLLMKDGKAAVYGETKEAITGKHLKSVYEIDVVGYMKESLRRWESLTI